MEGRRTKRENQLKVVEKIVLVFLSESKWQFRIVLWNEIRKGKEKNCEKTILVVVKLDIEFVKSKAQIGKVEMPNKRV